MSDFLGRLASRSMGLARFAEPVITAMLLSRPMTGESGERKRAEEFGPTVDETSEGTDSRKVHTMAARLRQRPSEWPLVSTPDFGVHDTTVTRADPQPASGAVTDRKTEIVFDEPPGSVATEAFPSAIPKPDPTVPLTSATQPPAERPARLAERAMPERSEAPVIRVTIGRIEVRAQVASAKPERVPAMQSKTAALSLDDYLKQRREGRR